MAVVTLLIAPTTTSFSAVKTLVTKQQTVHTLLIGSHADTCILLGFTANTNDASFGLVLTCKNSKLCLLPLLTNIAK